MFRSLAILNFLWYMHVQYISNYHQVAAELLKSIRFSFWATEKQFSKNKFALLFLHTTGNKCWIAKTT